MINTRHAALVLAAFLTACGNSADDDIANRIAAMPKVEAHPVALGKPGVGPGVTVTIASVAEESRIGEKGYGPETEPGETFVVVRYSIKNTSTKPLSSTDRPELELVDGAGQSYAEDTQAGILAAALNNDIQDSVGDLNPQVTAKDTAIWKINKASFDKKAWRIKATFGGLGARLDEAASWPLKPEAAPAPLTFSLQ